MGHLMSAVGVCLWNGTYNGKPAFLVRRPHNVKLWIFDVVWYVALSREHTKDIAREMGFSDTTTLNDYVRTGPEEDE